MLHVILLDCAIELIPLEMRALKQIQQYASRRRRPVSELLLDQTHHGRAMLRLEDHQRRGRPDITFLALHALLETPLCKAGLLSIHLHLQDSRIICIDPSVRLPRNYDRFVGLVEQLLTHGSVPPDGPPLLEVVQTDLPQLLRNLRGDDERALTVLAHESGDPTPVHALVEFLPSDPSVPVVVGVGAFPHGDLASDIISLFDTRISVDPDVLMAWHVCAEVLWAYTLRTGLDRWAERRMED